MTPAAARRLHALVAVVATAAVLLQLGLVVFGEPVLLEAARVGTGVRVARFFEYFTIQSNLLVAVVSTGLAVRPDRDGAAWRAVRVASLVGIIVTGVVHDVALRPLLDLAGANWAADKLLHVVVPVLAVLAWLAAGPRPRITWAALGWALLWPVAWLVVAFGVGAASGFYPYPFLDVGAQGWVAVAVSCLLVTAVFLLTGAALRLLDHRMDAVPRSRTGVPRARMPR